MVTLLTVSGMVLLLNVHVCFISELVMSNDYVHTQLCTVSLLRLLPMDLMGYQQPQHSQGQ